MIKVRYVSFKKKQSAILDLCASHVRSKIVSMLFFKLSHPSKWEKKCREKLIYHFQKLQLVIYT